MNVDTPLAILTRQIAAYFALQPADATHRRFLLSFDHNGQAQLAEVLHDALVIAPCDFAKVLGTPGNVPIKYMPGVIMAATRRLAGMAALVQKLPPEDANVSQT